jgi:hypothetical protein
MAQVDLYVGNTMWTGGEDFWLHSFFSTIAYQLEPEGWGSRFPALMNELYAGRRAGDRVPDARAGKRMTRWSTTVYFPRPWCSLLKPSLIPDSSRNPGQP